MLNIFEGYDLASMGHNTAGYIHLLVEAKVYLSVVDKDRNAVSFINSIYETFGSCLVAGDTGVVLQDRRSLFSLEPDHPNRLEPRKRPLHTIIPAMVAKDGLPVFSFGVMGGHMQPQGHVQVLLNMIDFGMDVQEAGEAPRVCHSLSGVALESGSDPRKDGCAIGY